MIPQAQAASSADPFSLSTLAEKFRTRAAETITEAAEQRTAVEVVLRVDPAPRDDAQQTLNAISVLIAAGAVHGVTLRPVTA